MSFTGNITGGSLSRLSPVRASVLRTAIPASRYNASRSELSMAKRLNGMAWGTAGMLALLVAGSIVSLGVRLRPYWVARYRGEDSSLRNASLSGALLPSANLARARLDAACLMHADLRNAWMLYTGLTGARLNNADL